MMKYFFKLILLFLILQIVKTNANSATVIIPANGVWWARSNTAASAHQCNLTLADSSSTLNNNCGSPDNNITINDPYPGTSTPQFKMYVWEYKSKTAPTSIGNSMPAIVNSCPSLPCNSGFLSSDGQYYFILAIKNFNTQPTEVNFNVLWDIECDASNTNSNSEPSSSNPKSSKSDGITQIIN
ncbi:hypothetical protein F8M41_023450 [Gigaspora margarita]|uniref:Uncharacterized protein n=1 Tax=Gigaspora margarita TaxID=4874 RepID=A0A8H4ADE0_GIGMA|nr:hypothetical protein F8M41_023450 [Gigaspora margarita]